ncbi:IclR family transcriptional regulator [Ferviditalea candida]|uniref:IclR family transcriptional regulator n=1 Tax=Ferviditalea candida TaxID=3108399 RepID=A0ABU5ZKA4_9BACL|nr:IclR family transcriptional regulator [Paenibacillaceae bacterium T2]
MTEPAKKDYQIHSVKNAMHILRLYSGERAELGVTEMSRLLGMSKSSVHRLVSTLTKEGFLEKSQNSNKYRLGLALLGLCGVITTHMEIHREAIPTLEILVEKLGEACHVCVLEGSDIVYLHKVECRHPVRLLSHIGKRNPAFCTSGGKSILAYQPESIVNSVIESGLTPYGPNTITDPAQFKENLQSIREQGYAVCIDELHEDVISIGSPIRDYSGDVVASVSVVGPKQRITPDKIPFFAATVLEAGREISQKLGYCGL